MTICVHERNSTDCLLGVRVLIADSDPAVRQQLLDWFRDQGALALATSAGWHCLHVLEDHPVDLFLASVGGGVDSAETVLLWLARLSAGRRPGCVLLAPTNNLEPFHGLSVDRVSVAGKPVDYEELLTKSRYVLS